jgi:hypothetical protein
MFRRTAVAAINDGFSALETYPKDQSIRIVGPHVDASYVCVLYSYFTHTLTEQQSRRAPLSTLHVCLYQPYGCLCLAQQVMVSPRRPTRASPTCSIHGDGATLPPRFAPYISTDLVAASQQGAAHKRRGELAEQQTMAKSGTEEWRRNADTHKMSAEEVRAAGVEASMRPPGRGPGEVLHQRGRRPLPYGPGTMALVGFGIVGVVGYLVLYQKARSGTPATEVAKVAVGHGDPAAGRDPEKRREGSREAK